MRNSLLTVLAFLSLSTTGAAQTVTPNVISPETLTGIMPFTAYSGVRENISLSNGNLHLYLPLFKLPQRAGGAWELGLEYDSKNYSLHLFPGPPNEELAFWKAETRFP